ncbi:MAG TPA: VTC domain-containing protein, partial [Methylobacter sp.]
MTFQRIAKDLSFLRREYKYLVPTSQLGAVRKFIAPHMAPDPHGLNYRVLSAYLDTPGLALWGDHAVLHKEDRYKLRIRTYSGLANQYFFEVKRKHDGVIEKQRASANEQEYQQIHKAIIEEKAVEA